MLFLYTTVALYFLGGYGAAGAAATLSKLKGEKSIDVIAGALMHGASWPLFSGYRIIQDITKFVESK